MILTMKMKMACSWEQTTRSLRHLGQFDMARDIDEDHNFDAEEEAMASMGHELFD